MKPRVDSKKTGGPDGVSSEAVKSCCARLYEQDVVRQLLGDSYHPGGLRLTSRLGELMELTPTSRVLDVASGTGTSALHLARTFGCEVVGIDYGAESVQRANEAASAEGLIERVSFQVGDSENLPVADASFDAIVCECAFCTFPDKAAAAVEFRRALRPGGRLGLSDVTRGDSSDASRGDVLALELQDLMAWVACIAEARSLTGYAAVLEAAGFRIQQATPEDSALKEMVQQIRTRLFGLELAAGLKKLDLPGIDFRSANRLARAAQIAIADGHLGYGIISAVR